MSVSDKRFLAAQRKIRRLERLVKRLKAWIAAVSKTR